MDLWGRLRLKSLFIPGGFMLGLAILLIWSDAWFGALKLSVSVVDLYLWSAFTVALLLAWRFHSGRVFSALIVLLLAHVALWVCSSRGSAAQCLTALEAISFLVPVNLALLVITTERGFSFQGLAPRFLFLLLESIFVAVLCLPAPAPGAHLFHGSLLHPSWFAWTRVPQISWLAFAVAMGVLLHRYLHHRKPVEIGFAWALVSFILALNRGGIDSGARAYAATSAVILAASIIETSYSMAYHDELTGLPSRRAFNASVLTLEVPYSVAVVDIDHFKSFNDTYGHDVGDDVLSLVAARLALVTGGGRAFRIGGEEFTILFPGKMAAEVVEHLELLRASVEASVLQPRGSDRRVTPRGPERRKAGPKKTRSRRPSAGSQARGLSVTVSIGLAEPASKDASVESVIELADKALYRAKANGRNRVEVGPAPRVHARKKTAQDSA